MPSRKFSFWIMIVAIGAALFGAHVSFVGLLSIIVCVPMIVVLRILSFAEGVRYAAEVRRAAARAGE